MTSVAHVLYSPSMRSHDISGTRTLASICQTRGHMTYVPTVAYNTAGTVCIPLVG